MNGTMTPSFATLKILSASGEWHDYSDMVKVKGIGWNHTDRNADGIRMTLDKHLHRVRVFSARKLTYKLFPDTPERYAALDDDLGQPVVKVQYNDLHGTQTRDFICTAFSAAIDYEIGSHSQASEGSFTLEEV